MTRLAPSSPRIRSLAPLGVALALCAPGGCFDAPAPLPHDSSDSDGSSSTTGASTLDGTSTRGDSDPSSSGDPGSSGEEGSSSAGDTTAEPLAPGGTIIPLYTYPTDPTWATVAAEAAAHPEVAVVAIINPASGPGQLADPNYTAGIAALSDAGVMVLGYVYTSYAMRPVAEVQTDIDAYASFYPALEGVMFDEMSNVPGDEAHYAGLSGYATGAGLPFTVGNPGTAVPESFVDTVDAMFIYEGTGLPDPNGFDAWIDEHDGERFAIIPHTAPSLEAGFVHAALEHVAWIYVTDDMLPNPWDSLPPYFGSLMDELEAG